MRSQFELVPHPNLLVEEGFLPKPDLETGVQEMTSIDEEDEDEEGESIVAPVKVKPK